MAIKAVVDNIEDVDEKYRDLYTKKGEKWEIQVEGLKTQADIDRVNAGLLKERKDHKESKDKLTAATTKLEAFGELDPDDVTAKLGELETLKATVGQKPDEQAIQERIRVGVERDLKRTLTPVQRKLDEATAKNKEFETTNGTLQAQISQRTVDDAVRSAASKAKVGETALEDAIIIGRSHFKVVDGKVQAEDGTEPEGWITDQKKTRPHWWSPAKGAGMQGNDGGSVAGKNPFSAKDWNMTEQGNLVKKDRAEADRFAKAAGTTIGGPRPPMPPAPAAAAAA